MYHEPIMWQQNSASNNDRGEAFELIFKSKMRMEKSHLTVLLVSDVLNLVFPKLSVRNTPWVGVGGGGVCLQRQYTAYCMSLELREENGVKPGVNP